MKLEITSSENLARLLLERGFVPDMRCNGSGRCGGCRVKLVSGEWECSGRPAAPPETVPACRTHLTGRSGVVEFNFPASAPVVDTSWRCRPLPAVPEVVAAIDLGTTTLAAVKLYDGKVIASAGCLNPQRRCGDNVVSRIAHANSVAGLAELRELLSEALNDLCAKLELPANCRIAVSGNTVMTSILHGVSPQPIGAYPFRPSQLLFPERTDLLPSFRVLTVPCISGYLGGDVSSGIYASKLAPGEMLVDLGTNCEIVFNTGRNWFGTSAAAGPAFEGSGLRSGSRAVSGAVDHYFSPENFSVIGDAAPSGICGSAYVDYLAVERASGRINEFGRFVAPEEPLREIAPGASVGEDDIEQLLKAKAAIYAGILSLERFCGAKAERLFLAGGFASGLDVKNAQSIGMLPLDREIRIIGNSSLFGAAALAVDPTLATELTRLSELPREVPLAELPTFESAFIDALLLP